MSGPCARHPLTLRWTNLDLSDQQNSCRLALFRHCDRRPLCTAKVEKTEKRATCSSLVSSFVGEDVCPRRHLADIATDLIARRVGPLHGKLVASPDYIGSTGLPRCRTNTSPIRRSCREPKPGNLWMATRQFPFIRKSGSKRIGHRSRRCRGSGARHRLASGSPAPLSRRAACSSSGLLVSTPHVKSEF